MPVIATAPVAPSSPALDALATEIWSRKYRLGGAGSQRESCYADTSRRVALAIAQAEPEAERGERFARFFEELRSQRFLPGGRILAGAGAGGFDSLLNCFVAGAVGDRIDGMLGTLRETALTLERGGGVGLDFSRVTPRGIFRRDHSVGIGPIAAMEIFDATCKALLSAHPRRGAMIAALRCDHPDIEHFIHAKHVGSDFARFNLSVEVSEELLQAVRDDLDWPLVFPAAELEGRSSQTVLRAWAGAVVSVPCRVLGRVRARTLWHELTSQAVRTGEPGVLFVDRINRYDNLWYRERLSCTNPCGEVPLPPHGACDLGSVNLVQFVRDPFTPEARFDLEALERTVQIAVRFLDDVLDVARYPVDAQLQEAHATRRIGLGVTGLADALVLLGRRYDQPDGRAAAVSVLAHLRDAAYRASIDLANERGPFPAFDRDRFLRSAYARSLPLQLRERIAQEGLHNGQLLAIAPAGSISLIAGNVSSGIEPLFAPTYRRRLLGHDGGERELTPWSLAAWRREPRSSPLPPAYADAGTMSADAQLMMVAAVQPYVDGGIAKTINLPEAGEASQLAAIFDRADALGLKGCTVFPACAERGVLSRR